MKIINRISTPTVTVCLTAIDEKYEVSRTEGLNSQYWQYDNLLEALKKYNELEENLK